MERQLRAGFEGGEAVESRVEVAGEVNECGEAIESGVEGGEAVESKVKDGEMAESRVKVAEEVGEGEEVAESGVEGEEAAKSGDEGNNAIIGAENPWEAQGSPMKSPYSSNFSLCLFV